MDELIKITTNEQGHKLVSARELHEFLEVSRDFTSWIKGRISKYKFVENEDYIIESLIHQNGGIKNTQGGDRKSIEYIITLNMAKELSMVENNDKGKQARQYFIACEEKLKEIDVEEAAFLSIRYLTYFIPTFFVGSKFLLVYLLLNR